MPAYQIQVRGTLDGATAFAPPAALPAPSAGGVIKIDAGVAINVGTFDLDSLANAQGNPVWLRALHVEFAALTRAARHQYQTTGSRQADRIIPDLESGAAAPLMRLLSLHDSCIVPTGSVLEILTDDTNDTFGGLPVAGPHFVYIDVEPIVSDEQMGLIQDLEAFASAKADAQGQQGVSFQAVAANGTEEVILVEAPRDILVTGMMMLEPDSLFAISDAVAAAGESMDFIINRITGGSTIAVASGTIDNTIAADTRISLVVNNANNIFLPGDRVQVQRAYTAGMAPTPIVNTLVGVKLVPLAF